MRNKKWYLVILKGKSKEWAYKYILENLKAPSFVYEPQNAYAAYEEVFGCKMISPQEEVARSLADENARLRAELEKRSIAVPEVTGQSEIEPEPEAPNFDFLTLEQFKDKWIAENGGADAPLKRGKAWAKYKKENGIA